jgi:hypothetical protein
MMFIKLKNAADGHKDEDIWINVDHITAIYEHAKVEGGGFTTFVHGRVGAPITWEVEESAREVMKMIEGKE